ncbi:MAG: NAD+ synthase [Alistipes sp.]|nr:NAD+ synthase [Alistipes sp.]MBQ5703473.1 NAD+ synthase [Alistipes sp.]MBQ6580985.1 NAD+ synthase [Alistipes sp.]
MKIALAQLNYTIGDIDANVAKIIDAVRKAECEGADLVLFAEYAVSGTPAYSLLRKTTFLTLCEEALETIAEACTRVTAIVGSPVLTERGAVSAAAVLRDGRVDQIVEKQYVTARREMGFIVEGEGYKTINICGRNIAVMVGNDLAHLSEIDSKAHFVVNVNSRRYGKGLLSRRLEMLRRLAYTEERNIIIINQVGGSGDLVYDGTSGIMNKRGEVELFMKSFEEDFVIFDTLAEHNPIKVPYTTYNDRVRLVYQAACLGLRDYFQKNGYKKACVGLSGGIDSSVVACLAVGALGKENVKGLMMPSHFSPDESVEDAKALAENLGIDYSVLPITEAYTAIIDTLKPVTGGTDFDATEENIQSRIRTVLLMALQNKDGYVLLNSSNKSENAIGWCTLYGDTAGAFSVTGDLYKSEIYDLARYINSRFDNVIPEIILKKEPSSELRPNQKDSDILPPYEVVDAILYRMIEEGQHREEIVNAGFDAEVVEKIHSMVMTNVKKRYQYPPVLRLSTRSFRHECLFPLVNKYGY